MARAYNAIDADGHILEPLDLWDKYIDPAFRERRPRFTIDENGKERLTVEGKLLGTPRGIVIPRREAPGNGRRRNGVLRLAVTLRPGDRHRGTAGSGAEGVPGAMTTQSQLASQPPPAVIANGGLGQPHWFASNCRRAPARSNAAAKWLGSPLNRRRRRTPRSTAMGFRA